MQGRNPAQLYGLAGNRSLYFPGAEERKQRGHELFYRQSPTLTTCSSCHPEGGDDGHVWNLDNLGPRRTPSLRGGLLATAPFNWDGKQADFTTLLPEIYDRFMGGHGFFFNEVTEMQGWLDALPALAKSVPGDLAAVARGRQLFNDPTVGCASCHSGPHFTNNQNAYVGTGDGFQVPALVDLAWRAPYMHSGCGVTLRDSFGPTCGGADQHGKTSQLGTGQVDDLIAYLETL